MIANSTEQPTCSTCKTTYTASDETALAHHNEPVSCGGCRRCDGRSACYLCTGMYCTCSTH
jgi:hypothetical protein